MNVVVNGDPTTLPDGATVALLAQARGLGTRGAAVAVDGVVVPRGQWSQHVLADGQSVELVHAVQGG